ncbi:MAG: hypothetical protein EZS26_002928, partial [Candidatus Ordinivivax streblomastigis]
MWIPFKKRLVSNRRIPLVNAKIRIYLNWIKERKLDFKEALKMVFERSEKAIFSAS